MSFKALFWHTFTHSALLEYFFTIKPYYVLDCMYYRCVCKATDLKNKSAETKMMEMLIIPPACWTLCSCSDGVYSLLETTAEGFFSLCNRFYGTEKSKPFVNIDSCAGSKSMEPPDTLDWLMSFWAFWGRQKLSFLCLVHLFSGCPRASTSLTQQSKCNVTFVSGKVLCLPLCINILKKSTAAAQKKGKPEVTYCSRL